MVEQLNKIARVIESKKEGIQLHESEAERLRVEVALAEQDLLLAEKLASESAKAGFVKLRHHFAEGSRENCFQKTCEEFFTGEEAYRLLKTKPVEKSFGFNHGYELL